MDRKKNLCEIVKRLMQPAIPEIEAYIRLYKYHRVCRSLKNSSYSHLYYYLNRLCMEGEVLGLFCSSGYRKRYCLDLKVKRSKKRLHPLIKFHSILSSQIFIYGLGRKKLKLNFATIRKKKKLELRNHTFVTFDSDLLRYYIVTNMLLIGVIGESDKKCPRLPGSTYGWGTEYERCQDLIKNENDIMTELGIQGERRATR